MNPELEPDPGRVCDIFRELVGIDSESRSEGQISRHVSEFFERLGCRCVDDGAGGKTGGECGNLVVRVDGAGGSGTRPLIYSAHLDTVEPGREVVLLEDEETFTSDGRTVLGADDKAGLAAIMAAVEALAAKGARHGPLEVVLTVQEELGLAGARNLDFSLVDGNRAVVLDGSGGIGGIVTEAPTRWYMRFTVTGRSAHAGIEPERGVNAVACAANAVSRLETGRLDGGTTTNVGVIQGGTAANVVPGRAVVTCEVRGLSDARAEEEKSKMREAFELAASGAGCSLEVEETCSFRRFAIDTGSEHVRHIASSMEACGIEPFYITSGGGSDANVFNEHGIEAVNINMGFRDAHSGRESVGKADLAAAASLLFTMAASMRVSGE